MKCRGWVVVGSSFSFHFACLGVLYAQGVFTLPMAASFGTGRGEVAWAGSLVGSSMVFCATFTAGLLDRWGVRPTFAFGSVAVSIALALLSLSRTLIAALAASSAVGCSLAFCSVNAIGIVQPWFTARRGLATGIAMAGSGLGNFAFALAMQVRRRC